MLVETAQAIPVIFSAIGTKSHKYVVFAEHAEAGFLINTLEEALHLSIVQADITPTAVADQVMVRRFTHQFIDPPTGDFITVNQAVAAEGLQRAVECGAADAGFHGAHLLVKLVEGGVFAAAADGFQDHLALGGHAEAEIAGALLQKGIGDWDHMQYLVENFCNKPS